MSWKDASLVAPLTNGIKPIFYATRYAPRSFAYTQGCEVVQSRIHNDSPVSGRRGRSFSPSTSSLSGKPIVTMLPSRVTSASRTFFEVSQALHCPLPLVVTVDARSDPVLSGFAAAAASLLGCSKEDDLSRLKVLLSCVLAYTGGAPHFSEGSSGAPTDLNRLWVQVRRSESRRMSQRGAER